MAKLLLLVAVLAAVLATGLAGIRCHVCNSAEHTKCNDPFVYDSGRTVTQDFEMDCDQAMKDRGYELPAGESWKYCRKIYQNVRGDERIIRTCGWEQDEKGRECYKTVLEEYNTYVCSCEVSKDGPLCNAGNRLNLGWSALLALVPALVSIKILS